MVLWIIGMSGSGKTTIAREFYNKTKSKINNLVLLDGDILRDVFANDADYTIEGRYKNASRISKLSNMLANQDIHVVAAVLSIFPEWQKWNRENLKDYTEVYLKVSLEKLKERDIKNLYKPASEGKIKNVVGIDIPFPEPANSDLVVDNTKDRTNYDDIMNQILSLNNIKKII